ncbi:MAG: UDP-N-acetylmuramate--L-alanine ligase [bacterium]|nr:UDP-N-acetylmuramate--L-alanine ligase [bacterium]
MINFPYHSIFFVGIKGVAMSNLAVILKKLGKKVTGSDVHEEFITDQLLQKHSINYSIGFDKDKIPDDCDLVIYSGSHKGIENPQVNEAVNRKITIMNQAEVLGLIIKNFRKSIAVCGCHGKTTTSSLLTYALLKLKKNPSYLIGVPFFGQYQGADMQDSDYFIVEADEYGINPPIDKTPKFLHLNPLRIICTNIDFDHPDVYENIEETKKAFLKFFGNKQLILCGDDENIRVILSQLDPAKITTYGFSFNCDMQIMNDNSIKYGSVFEIQDLRNNISLGKYEINLFGKKNISNAAAVIVILLQLGFKPVEIAQSLKGFVGAERRFEKKFELNETYIFDDYAHHPNEIKATIDAARQHFPNKKIIIIFQPHTFSRTKALLYEFEESLSLADKTYILPIFASARENKAEFHISSNDIVKNQGSNKTMVVVEDHAQLIKQMYKDVQKGDIIITMGAGDVYKLKDDIIKVIKELK